MQPEIEGQVGRVQQHCLLELAIFIDVKMKSNPAVRYNLGRFDREAGYIFTVWYYDKVWLTASELRAMTYDLINTHQAPLKMSIFRDSKLYCSATAFSAC